MDNLKHPETLYPYLNWISEFEKGKPGLEAVILGACMLEDAFYKVNEFLSLVNFTGLNRHVWKAMYLLHAFKKPIDMKTVYHQMMLDHQAFSAFSKKKAEMALYIVNLTNHVNSAANIQVHAIMLLEMRILSATLTTVQEYPATGHLLVDKMDFLESLMLSSDKFSLIEKFIDYTIYQYPDEEMVKDLQEIKRMTSVRANKIREAI